MLALLVTALALGEHSLLLRRLDDDTTKNLEEKARGLHGYLRFTSGTPVLRYNQDDPESAAFVDDATDYYQVYNAQTGHLLTQSSGLEALGLDYTPDEVAAIRDHPGVADVRTDRGRLRLASTLISPGPGELYLVQVGELLDGVDRTIAGFDKLLLWRILIGLGLAVVVGRWLAGRALTPLSGLAVAAAGIDIKNLHAR